MIGFLKKFINSTIGTPNVKPLDVMLEETRQMIYINDLMVSGKNSYVLQNEQLVEKLISTNDMMKSPAIALSILEGMSNERIICLALSKAAGSSQTFQTLQSLCNNKAVISALFKHKAFSDSITRGSKLYPKLLNSSLVTNGKYNQDLRYYNNGIPRSSDGQFLMPTTKPVIVLGVKTEQGILYGDDKYVEIRPALKDGSTKKYSYKESYNKFLDVFDIFLRFECRAGETNSSFHYHIKYIELN